MAALRVEGGWALQGRARASEPQRNDIGLSQGFGAFLAQPANDWRSSVRRVPERGSHVQSKEPAPAPAATLAQTRVQPAFSGPDWGVGGSVGGGRKYIAPPPAVDYKRAERRHLREVDGVARGEYVIEDVLNRKRHVRREDGQPAATERSTSFFLENRMGRRGRHPLQAVLRDGELIPAGVGSDQCEHVVYANGYFKQEGVTPNVRLGIKRYAPSRRGDVGKIRERPKTLSFHERNAADVLAAEQALVSSLELSYDEEACSPRPPPPERPSTAGSQKGKRPSTAEREKQKAK